MEVMWLFYFVNRLPGQSLAKALSGSGPMICASQPPSLAISVPGFREDAVEAYCEWHCSKVRREDQKEQYRLARDLTLDRGFDLELLHENNDAQFYIERGVLEGVARRFVRDVTVFLDQYSVF